MLQSMQGLICKMKTREILILPDDVAKKQPIILFDDECALCSRSLRFVLRHNRSGNLCFASLQSEVGSEIVRRAGKTFQQSDTLLLMENNILYSYSTAALKIAAYLDFPWRLTGIFSIVPVPFRDLVYRYIAKNRYAWFGRKSFCLADEKEYQNRFLS